MIVIKCWVLRTGKAGTVFLVTYVFQTLSGDHRTGVLLEMLVKRPNSLLPVFCQSLEEVGQAHVVDILRDRGQFHSHSYSSGLPSQILTCTQLKGHWLCLF